MVFSSLDFIFVFLPVFFGLYYITPEDYKNITLLVGSSVFYIYGTWQRPWVIALFFALNLLTYLVAFRILRQPAQGKYMLQGMICLIVVSLLTFKYIGLFGLSVVLPLGLSFYSFQLIAYLMDVQEKRIKVERSFLKFMSMMLLFPKLISGPLVQHAPLSKEMERRSLSWADFQDGLQDFILGLAMKCLIADQVGGLWFQVKSLGFTSMSTLLAWLGLLAFSLQLYFDFYGYSRMAIGLGKMMGFHLPINFDLPYTAKSMSEFWRRWHITLGRWFVSYVYIPLGGNQGGRLRHIRNLGIVWLLTAIWHGDSWNFLLWGAFIFLLIILEKSGLEQPLHRYPLLGHTYLIVVVMLSWMFFAIPSVPDIGIYISRLFGFVAETGSTIRFLDTLKLTKSYILPLLVGVLIASPYPRRIWLQIRKTPLATWLLFVFFWLSIYCLSAGLNDPFLYFSF